MTKEEPKRESRVVGAVDFFIVWPASMLATSGAFYLLYGWHVLPLTGYALGFWQVCGLRLTLVVARNFFWMPKLKSDTSGILGSIALIFYAGLAILLGWLAKQMM